MPRADRPEPGAGHIATAAGPLDGGADQTAAQALHRIDVIIDNDANAAAIGERWSGHGRTASDFAFLYMGTGIGGAMFLSKHIYRGVSLNAGRVRPHRRRAERHPLLLR